jgi:glycosyltransferase involved in cell wall biosynthesis
MSKNNKLTVVILAKDVANEIIPALKSARFADQIIVVDTGTTKDNTVEISKRHADKVVMTGGSDFSKWRNLGAQKADGEWIFYLDSDERVPPKLAREINQVIESPDSLPAYTVPRFEVLLGKHLAHWGDSRVIRLIKKDKLIKWVGKLHEQPKIDGDIGDLKHKLIHLTHKNIDEKTTATFAWSRTEAQLMFDANHPKMTWWRFYRIIFTEIVLRGLRQGLIWDGTEGHIEILYQSFSRFLSYVRLWELQQKPSLKEIYDEVDKKIIEEWKEEKI